jgi:hypothetical protein
MCLAVSRVAVGGLARDISGERGVVVAGGQTRRYLRVQQQAYNPPANPRPATTMAHGPPAAVAVLLLAFHAWHVSEDSSHATTWTTRPHFLLPASSASGVGKGERGSARCGTLLLGHLGAQQQPAWWHR